MQRFQMASEEQKELSELIKSCHDELRDCSRKRGYQQAWQDHLQDTERLQTYAKAMHRLSLIWEENSTNAVKSPKTSSSSSPSSASGDICIRNQSRNRIEWISDYCKLYFWSDLLYLEKRKREQRLLMSWNLYDAERFATLDKVSEKRLKLLDVGSCFNPFARDEQFQVTAIDLCPATDNVYQADFLQIPMQVMSEGEWHRIESDLHEKRMRIPCLPSNYYECVIFSLLLEYIPSSEQRLLCCRRAYELLVTEGILIIVTPDSNPVGKNANLMKSWRHTLADLGFMRISFTKLTHITCLVFRKAADPRVAQEWSRLHRSHENHKDILAGLPIPQDRKQPK